MASATSDTLISNLQEITLGVVFDLHARVDRANFGGDSEMPTAEWDTTDDAKEDRKLNRASKGLADGVLSKHDPRVIALYGLTPLDGDDLAAAAAHQASMVAAGLAPASAQPMDAQGVAVVLGQYRDGEIGPTAAALLLSQALPNASAERINRILEEERRAVAAVTVEGEPAAAQAAPEATTPAEEGMNGAQIAALQEIVAGVSGRTTAPGAAVLMIQTAFPLLPAGRAQAIVDQAAAFAPAAPTPETQRAFAEVFARLEARLGNPAYDNSRPPPIRQDLVRAAREVPLSEVEAVAFADETVPRVWEWLSTVDYADATVRATTVATMARHYATEATRNAS
ncbi:MAG TPA: hypothetical protein DCQ64_15960 [Candidatus Rokubacteria bacterium]|nr:hypothetical protein [Candidatus Rokubacteria bacterium]